MKMDFGRQSKEKFEVDVVPLQHGATDLQAMELQLATAAESKDRLMT